MTSLGSSVNKASNTLGCRSAVSSTDLSSSINPDNSGRCTTNYYTKSELRSSGGAEVHWNNLTNVDESDPIWEGDKVRLLGAESAGRLYGGEISQSETQGWVTIAPGAGWIKNQSAGLEDVPMGLMQGQASLITYVSWSEYDVELAGIGYNMIYFDASANIFVATLKEDFYSVFDFTRDFTVGRVYYDGTTIHIRLCGMNRWNFPRRVQMFGEERFPVERATGLMISGTGTRNVAITAGVIWAELVNRFSIDALDTSGTDTFTYWYRDGSGGWIAVADQTQIDNLNYDDNSGTLEELLNVNRYGVHWVYVDHMSNMHVVYGQYNYTLTEANNATTLSSLPGLVGAYATLVGKIIIQKSAGSFTSVQSPFVTQFQAGAVSNHNDLSGLQGGTTNEYYHFTAAQYNALIALIS